MFIEKKASKSSIGGRKNIYGVGVNDCDYLVELREDGKRYRCPYYQRWSSMLTRCYSEKFLEKNNTYRGCYVDPEWLIFTNFKEWMKSQDWEGKALDKDIITPNNKEYGPYHCKFIPQELNNLLCDHAAKRGAYPTGVTFDKSRDRFSSKISIKGKTVNLGRFSSAAEAESTYLKAKTRQLGILLLRTKDKDIFQGLCKHIEILETKLQEMNNEKI